MATTILVLLAIILVAAILCIAFFIHVCMAYGNDVIHVFEKRPPFNTFQGEPDPDAEKISFANGRGEKLAGAYIKSTTGERRGTLVFCPEYSGNRWGWQRYLKPFRDEGYDIFSFDFNNQGDSERDPNYDPLHWVSNREVDDLNAALDYLAARPDFDERTGVVLHGVSRGGNAALVVGSRPEVRGVVTDGAFPTRGTVVHYTFRWVSIYVPRWAKTIYNNLPRTFYIGLFESVVGRGQRRRGVIFARPERHVDKMNHKPLLMIHGGRDNYIAKEIVDRFYKSIDNKNKQLVYIPKSKHNMAVTVDPEAYYGAIRAFLEKVFPAPRKTGSSSPIEPAALDKAPKPAAKSTAERVGESRA